MTYDRDEWYTPAYLLDAARYVLKSITLDPASNPQANELVKAEKYYTKADNALDRAWRGNVWCNPPYSRGNVEAFVNKAIEQYSNGNMAAGLMLVNNATETGWFQQLLADAESVCFLNSRVKFYHPERGGDSPRQGQALFYFGKEQARLRFHDRFSDLGTVLRLI